MDCRNSPIIVIGMHRSGTSMLIRNLEAMGLFAGQTGDNHEAVFFFRIDQWLMSQSGASWENPQAVRYLLENQKVRSLTADYIVSCYVDSPRVVSFLGCREYLRYRTPFKLPMPWGWKCPLATFTLPIWLDIFPRAKVIHIYRHGVDVAASLRERTLRVSRTRGQELYYKTRLLHWMRPKVGGFVRGLRCATLEGGFSLWEEYLSAARRHTRRLGDQAVEVRYEDLLSEPDRSLKQLAKFCGLSVCDETVKRASAKIKAARAYAYRESPELQSFANSLAERLEAHGYREGQNQFGEVGTECVSRSRIAR